MTILALQSGDWASVTVAIIIVGCVIGGMVKFSRALRVLKRGRPEIDAELAEEQEFQNNEQND
ncbi:MAG: hypothetical protein OSB05_06880 [Akkermansiaceae bacterium]|nr:hypothetical protein [Akkermansiaceae bacterium]